MTDDERVERTRLGLDALSDEWWDAATRLDLEIELRIGLFAPRFRGREEDDLG